MPSLPPRVPHRLRLFRDDTRTPVSVPAEAVDSSALLDLRCELTLTRQVIASLSDDGRAGILDCLIIPVASDLEGKLKRLQSNIAVIEMDKRYKE